MQSTVGMLHSASHASRRESRGSDIENVLAELEDEVGVPIVAGEGRRWCESIIDLFERVDAAWREQVGIDHASLDETIRTDVDLAVQVEKLEHRDEAVSRTLEDLKGRTAELYDIARDSRGGAEPTKMIEELRMDWLRWIVESRALEKEIRTWLVEASYRDTGCGD